MPKIKIQIEKIHVDCHIIICISVHDKSIKHKLVISLIRLMSINSSLTAHQHQVVCFEAIFLK